MDDTQAFSGFMLARYDAPYAEMDQPRSTYPYTLPNELWTMIWEYLPFVDCLTLCSVCKNWNSLAMSSARLWTELCVASPPLEGEKADESGDWDEDEYDEDEMLSDDEMAANYVSRVPGIPPGSITSIGVLTDVLARTRSLGLTFYVVLYGAVARAFLEQLTYVLLSHKRRIMELHLFFVRPWVARTLLVSLQPLEILRCLQLHSPYDHAYCDETDHNPRCHDSGWNIYEIADLVDDYPTTFNMLESFTSSETFSWYNMTHPLPRLTSLCLAANDYGMVERAFVVCPRLEHFCAHMGFHTAGLPRNPEMSQEVLDIAVRLRTVRITQVHNSHRLWLRRLFASATREVYSLSYLHRCKVDQDCPNILDDIARPTHIRVTFTSLRMNIEIEDDGPQRQQRSLSLSIASVDYAWELLRRIHGSNVRFIRCSWLAWDPLSTFKTLCSLEVLELVVEDDPHVLATDALPVPSWNRKPAIRDMVATAVPYVHSLPALHTLRICRPEHGATSYMAHWHADLKARIRRLCDVLAFLPVPLQLDVSDEFYYLAH